MRRNLLGESVSTRIISTRNNTSRALTAAEFHQLSNVPPEAEWFANLDNPRTRRAYQTDLRDFMGFVGKRLTWAVRPRACT